MYIKRNYSFWMTFNWSKKPFIIGFLYSFVICIIAYFLERDLSLSWSPISVMGIAVAFYLGFKNNSSYDRTWEARKIWGSIVNNSRTFGAAVTSFIEMKNKEEVQRELIYRHIAWLTILRIQLRRAKPWEHNEELGHGFESIKGNADLSLDWEKEVQTYITKDEIAMLKTKSNCATQILRIQSERLQELRNLGAFEDFRHMEFHQLITTFYEDQGKSERIKNFPFPRQYASTAMWMTFVFSFFVPFGMLGIFQSANSIAMFVCPLLSGIIIWIFFLMEKIGDYSENPFEGTYNDVPITSIARGIEIDMREMINDDDIPAPTDAVNGFLM